MYKWTTTAHVMYMVVVFERKETKKWTVLLCSWIRMIHLLQNLHAFLYKWFPIYRNNHVLLQYLSPKLLYQHENTHCKPWPCCHLMKMTVLKNKSFLSNEALPSSSLAWACTRNLAVEIFDCIINVKMDFLILDFYRKRVKFHYD